MAQTLISGSNYLTAAAPSRTSAADCTFAARVYLTSWGGAFGGSTGNIFGVYSTLSTNDRIWLYTDSGQTGHVFFSVEQGAFSSYAEVDITGFSLNTWYHLAFTTSSGGTITCYVDGVVASGTLLTGGAGFAGWTALTWNTFVVGDIVGQVQDCVAYTSEISAAEVAQLARCSNPLRRTGLAAQYPLFSDSPLADFSGNGRTLSISGTVTAGTSPHAPASWGGGRTQRLFIPASSGTSITAAGSTQTTGAAALTKAASAAAAGSTQVTGAAAITSAASAASAGSTRTTGTAALTAGASAAAAGSTQTTGAAALTSAAAVAGAGTTQTTGSATILALFPVAAGGSTQVTGTAVVTSYTGGSAAASGSTQTTGAAAITAGAALAGSGTTQVTGAAAVTKAASAAAAGGTQVTGSAAMTVGAAVAAAGSTQVTGAAALLANFPQAGSGSTVVTGIAVVTSSSPAPVAPVAGGRGRARMGVGRRIVRPRT